MRKAASMIEMVIAIVVMGIAVSALPLILTQSQNSNAFSLQQETILATKAKLGYILAYEWDANSYDASTSISRVLDTTASPAAHDAFDVNATTLIRRVGHINADKRRRLFDVGHAQRSPQAETAGFDDIDDFNGRDENITITPNNEDYIFTINLHSNVTYIGDGRGLVNYDNNVTAFTFDKDTNTTNPTNIKMVTVTTTGNNMNIVMRAFASNIGESGILRKAW